MCELTLNSLLAMILWCSHLYSGASSYKSQYSNNLKTLLGMLGFFNLGNSEPDSVSKELGL